MTLLQDWTMKRKREHSMISYDGPWPCAMHEETASRVSKCVAHVFLLDGGTISVISSNRGIALLSAHVHYMSNFIPCIIHALNSCSL